MFIKNIHPNTINIILSNLSKTPPCPGIKLETSLVLKYLLIAEKHKSPIWPKTLKNKVINIKINS